VEPQGVPGPRFSFAFQPIVDATTHEVFSYEALIRGPGDEPAFIKYWNRYQPID
jgi:blue light- and temperature-responsive anti-repressor